MDPHVKHKRAFEMLGDGEPSDEAGLNPGVSGNGTFQKNQGAQNKTGNMSTTGGTLTTKGYPGWSSTPDGKGYDKDQEPGVKYQPIEVGEGLDDDDMHVTQDDSGLGGLSKQIPVSFGGRNPSFDRDGAKRR